MYQVTLFLNRKHVFTTNKLSKVVEYVRAEYDLCVVDLTSGQWRSACGGTWVTMWTNKGHLANEVIG